MGLSLVLGLRLWPHPENVVSNVLFGIDVV